MQLFIINPQNHFSLIPHATRIIKTNPSKMCICVRNSTHMANRSDLYCYQIISIHRIRLLLPGPSLCSESGPVVSLLVYGRLYTPGIETPVKNHNEVSGSASDTHQGCVLGERRKVCIVEREKSNSFWAKH